MYSLFILAGAAILAGVDQLTKLLAETYLKGNDPFVLINGIFELRYIQNPGAAFGMFGGYRIALIIFTSIALIALYVAMVTGKLGRSKLVTVSGTMIIAGGIGNLIDRIFRHEVIDFFYFRAINFAIFNVADSFVVIGASLILIYFLFIYKEDKAGHPKHMLTKSGEAVREEDAADGASDTESFAGEDRGEA